MTASGRHSESGFTMLELLIVMGLMLVVFAGTSQVMNTALRTEEASEQVLDMNSHLRAAMDLLQRDMLQVGQGLPIGRRAGVPNGPGAELIVRPGPAVSGECPGTGTFTDSPTLPAVSPGAGLGPPVNGVCTDVVTTLAADNMFAQERVSWIATNGQSARIHSSALISDNPDAQGDNLRPGDLLLFYKGSESVLVQVTAVAGQVVTFGTDPDDDPLNLNQFVAGVDGTTRWYRAQAPPDPSTGTAAGPSLATRVRMTTYYVDTDIDENNPRLMRIAGGAAANAIAFGVTAFRLTYDLADQVTNPTNVRMNADDLSGSGACPDDPATDEIVESCSENQIRKVNILLSMDARSGRGQQTASTTRQAQNSLYTQVSLRSMAFVDRYR